MRGERNQFWDDNVMRWQVPGLSHDTRYTGKLQSYLVFRVQSQDGNDLPAYNQFFRTRFIQWTGALAAGSFRSQTAEFTPESLAGDWSAWSLPDSHWLPVGDLFRIIGQQQTKRLSDRKQMCFYPCSQQSPVFRLARLVRLLSCVIITAPRNPSSEECAMSKVWSHPNYPIIRDWVSVGPLMSHRKHGEQSWADQQLSGILRKLTSDTTWIWTFPKPSPFSRVITADCESISWTHEQTFT